MIAVLHILSLNKWRSHFLIFIGLTSGLSSCCDEPIHPSEYPLSIFYLEASGNNLLQDDEQIRDNLFIYTSLNDTIDYNIHDDPSYRNGRFLTFQPFKTLNYEFGKEEQNVIYLNYYQDVDTLELVSLFERGSCGDDIRYLNISLNGEALPDESAGIRIYK